MTLYIESVAKCIDNVIDHLGNHIVCATALAAGKPNYLINELYARAKKNASIKLTILTGLTLEKPKGNSFLEKRFLGPFVDRVFGDYPDLDYEVDRRAKKLPANIEVIEFFLAPGKWVHDGSTQRNYIASNYTHVTRDCLARGVNLVLAQLAKEESEKKVRYSLASNTDTAPDLIAEMRARKRGLIVAQVNGNLPFMVGSALCEAHNFDIIVDVPKQYFQIFGPPKKQVTQTDHLIGMFGSCLVPEGGEIQIGIGSLGDSLVHALRLRHQENSEYKKVLNALGVDEKSSLVQTTGGSDPFREGLFASTEMFVDGLLELMKLGIVKKKVWDDCFLQRLINEKRVSQEVTFKTLELLEKEGAINKQLSLKDVFFLKKFGIFKTTVEWVDGTLFTETKESGSADIYESREFIEAHCLGDELKEGKVIHGGFFLGPQSFYRELKNLPPEQRALIDMRSVSRINQLYGHEELDRLQKRNSRFFNTCLMVTLGGAAVSDGLSNGEVVSGIGGQYNFVSMAHALDNARSILSLRSTRGGSVSNIVWNYGHISIPRHLRDIVITEYGIADLRSKTDGEIADSLIRIADSRFQKALVKKAIHFGKLPADYQIPEKHRYNIPEPWADRLKPFKNLFPPFPLGCDYTPVEQDLIKAMQSIKKNAKGHRLVKLLLQSLPEVLNPTPGYEEHLDRMGLLCPKGNQERLSKALLLRSLQKQNSNLKKRKFKPAYS